MLQLPVPIFLPGRSDDPAPVERPLKWSEHPDPLDTSGFASRSEMEKGKDENAESEDGAPSGAAAAGGDEDEGGDHSRRLWIQRLKASCLQRLER